MLEFRRQAVRFKKFRVQGLGDFQVFALGLGFVEWTSSV